MMAARYGLRLVSSSALLKQVMEQGGKAGRKVRMFLKSMRSVPAELLVEIVQQELATATEGWVLDGFPQTKAQAEAMTAAGIAADRVVVLKASTMEGRDRQCRTNSKPTTHALLAGAIPITTEIGASIDVLQN